MLSLFPPPNFTRTLDIGRRLGIFNFDATFLAVRQHQHLLCHSIVRIYSNSCGRKTNYDPGWHWALWAYFPASIPTRNLGVDFSLARNVLHSDSVLDSSSPGFGGADCSFARTHQLLHPRPQTHHRQGMNLRHPGLPYPQHRPHFLHRQFFKVIKSQHLLLFFRQVRDHPRQQCLHLRTHATEKWRVLGCVRQVIAQIFLLAVPRRFQVKTAHFEPVQFSQQLLEFPQFQIQLRRYLHLRRSAAQLQTQLALRLFHPARLAPQVPRPPVHFPQTVQHRAPDAELGIGTELHLLRAIELVERIDQSDHSRMHQILQRHMPGQALVNPARQITHLRQLFEQNAVALVSVPISAFVFVFVLLFLFLFVLSAAVGLRRVLAHDPLLASIRILRPSFRVSWLKPGRTKCRAAGPSPSPGFLCVLVSIPHPPAPSPPAPPTTPAQAGRRQPAAPHASECESRTRPLHYRSPSAPRCPARQGLAPIPGTGILHWPFLAAPPSVPAKTPHRTRASCRRSSLRPPAPVHPEPPAAEPSTQSSPVLLFSLLPHPPLPGSPRPGRACVPSVPDPGASRPRIARECAAWPVPPPSSIATRSTAGSGHAAVAPAGCARPPPGVISRSVLDRRRAGSCGESRRCSRVPTQLIAHAPHRVNQLAGMSIVHFAPQIVDINVHHVRG